MFKKNQALFALPWGLIVAMGAFFYTFSAFPAHAAIANGMPAIDEIGQIDASVTTRISSIFTTSNANGNGMGINMFGLSGPGFAGAIAMDTTSHRLFLGDTNNRRVLVFALNADNSIASKAPVNVIGQANFVSGASAVVASSTTTGFVEGLAYDAANSRLFVSDTVNNRVLVFDASNVSNGMAASYVLGQSNFTNSASATSASGMWSPVTLAYDPGTSRLFTGDSSNNRVLVFDLSSGISNGMAASNVIGEPDFSFHYNLGASQTAFSGVRGLAYDSSGQRLFLSDTNNHRALVFDLSSGITNGMAASKVLGQADFAGHTADVPATSASFNFPRGLAYDASGHRLFVPESGNRRVMVFSVGTTISDITNGQAAVHVLGKSDFVTSTAQTSSTGMSTADALAYDASNNRLLASDSGNNRLLVFNVASITDGQAASDEIGQYDHSSSDPFNTTVDYTRSSVQNGGVGRLGLNLNSGSGGISQMSIDSVHHRLFVPDAGNNRVLVFNLNSDDTVSDMIPDNVLGQPDFVTVTVGTTASKMNQPTAAMYDPAGDRLFVTELVNNRILVFDTSSGITDGMSAIYAIGQPNLTTGTATATQTGLNSPSELAYDSSAKRLFVNDSSNRRIVMYDISAGGSLTGINAAYVLGQPGFTSANILDGGYTTGMSTPTGVAYDAVNQRLFVGDFNDYRVITFDVRPSGSSSASSCGVSHTGIANGMSASCIIGQPNFSAPSPATTQTGLNFVGQVTYESTNQRLFVTDFGNNRLMVYDLSGGLSNGPAAAYVIGQADFTHGSVNGGGTVSATGLNPGTGVLFDGANQRLYEADRNNNRVMIYDVATTTGSITPTLNNSVTLSNSAAGASATVTISYQLMHNLSSPLTVAFPAGFTVTAAAQAGSSSSCLSGFGFTSTTLTANKTNCAGPITLGGAVVTNPSTGGSYTISWTNDDPGSAMVTVTGGGGGGGGQPATPSVMVIQPNGGESLTAGQTYDIVWASGGTIDSYRLSYSSDNGTSWNLVASGLHGNFYNWTVPEVSTTQARIRVEGLNSMNSVIASDDTNSNFAIVSTPPPANPPPAEPPPPTHDFNPAQETANTTTIDQDLGLVAIANPLCTPGSVIRGSRPAVFYCGIDGKRYAFPNEKTWFTWFSGFSQVQFLTNAQVAAIPLAPGYAPYRPGVKMVKLQTDSKVYAVTAGSVLRLVPSEQVAFDLYGPAWNTKIDDIPAPFWSSYTIGAPIN